MNTNNRNVATETFEQMSDTMGDAMRTGMKLNEEAARMCFDMLGRGSEMFRTRMTKMDDEAMPFGRKSVERMTRMCDENARRTMGIFKNMAEMTTARNPMDMTDRMMSACRESFDMMFETMDAVCRTNAAMYENMTETMGSTRPQATKTNAKASRK